MSFPLCCVGTIPQLSALPLLFYHYCYIIIYFISATALSVKGKFCPGPGEECRTPFSSALCSAPQHQTRGLRPRVAMGSSSEAVRKRQGLTELTKQRVKHSVRLFPASSQSKVESMNEIKRRTSDLLQQKMPYWFSCRLPKCWFLAGLQFSVRERLCWKMINRLLQQSQNNLYLSS